MKPDRALLYLVSLSVVVLVWSAIKPDDYGTWLFEIMAPVCEVAVLAITFKRFRFSNLAFVLVGIHFIILAIGAHYTYAEMPLFNWLKERFNLSRNYYDRVGHFFQGFVPAMLMREILLRCTPLQAGKMAALLCGSVALAISALWELLEMWTVKLFHADDGVQWLGMQGDVWDTQMDMQMALIGAVVALFVLSKLHDRSIRNVAQHKIQAA
jgi:putative membrane protein